MTVCKYNSGRKVPIIINEEENFAHMNPDCFFICLIYSGTAIIVLNGERCYIGTNTIICLNKNDHLHVLSTNNLMAKSISFTPEFINVNLNYDTILAENYLNLCRKHHYPSFDLFYWRNIIYNGIMPLNMEIFEILPGFLEESIKQVKDQPDKKMVLQSKG